MLIYKCLRGLLSRGFGANNILVLGATEAGKKIAEALAKTPERGQRVVGFVDERYQVMDHEFANVPVLGKYSDLATLIKKYKVTGIIIAHESSSPQEIMRVLVWVCDQPVHIYLVPELYSVVHGQFKANLVYGFELQELFAFTMPLWQVRVKRVIDILFGAFLGLISFPVCVLAAIAIKLEDHGPVFYSQERIGLYGKPFTVYKFRTMRTDAEKFGAQWATKDDPRITKVGKFLRKTRIDELPQILCVLKGDMSMVGPRPERAVFIAKLREEIPFYISRLKMKPGLTGWAQVCHHYDTSTEDVKIKLRYDMYYFENMSLLLDFQILVRTVYVVLTGKGAQ
jgi:exopolysaccharide biosynthesis polyprenyl glycosylphosphotransferase